MNARQTDRHAHGQESHAALILVALSAVIGAVASVDIAVQLGAKLAHWRRQPPASPAMLIRRLIDGRTAWPPRATPILVAELAVLFVIVVLLAIAGQKARRGRRSTDRAAPLMRLSGRDSPLTLRRAEQTAARFGIDTPGLQVARTVHGNQPLIATWEDMSVDIWGPRRGKSTSRAIPTVISAPGPVLATSNKPDLFIACSGLRSEHGRVYNFDPQRICAGTEPDWWWNPLSYVTSERRASELTSAFVDAYRSPDARTDAYFDKAGQSLIAGLLQAAALDGRPLTDVYVWSTREDDETPALILEAHDLPLAAASVRSVIDAPHEQRGGVYGTASELLSFLRDPDVARWITDPSGERPQLDLQQFVVSKDTLFLHSKEGPGSSAGLVTGLTMALCDAAEQHASRTPRGRLVVPMVGVLDEAANICRWRQLPNLYSHYGSRGIVLLTILQSWSQGCEVWGEAGMKKLWGASNVRCYGGGAAERHFLSDLEAQIGEYNRRVRSPSSSSGPGGTSRSTSEQLVPTPILTVAELASLPSGRVVVIASGAPPILARPVPFWETEHAQAIQAAIDGHDPTPHVAAIDQAEATRNPYRSL